MKKTTGSDGDAPGRESVHELRLVALLLDLVERHGRSDTAEILGVSYDTVARAAASGRLTGRVSDALARHLLEGTGPQAIAEQRKLLEDLERRLAELEEATTGQVGDGVRSEDRDGTLSRLTEGMESLTRRVEGLETRHLLVDSQASAAIAAPSQTRPMDHLVVSDQPEPDEAERFGGAAPLVAEWRRLRDAFDATPDELAKLLAERDLLDLEIVMIGVCGLTLPPQEYPWDEFEIVDETRRRQRRMAEMREEIRTVKRRRRLRRICTLGVWGR